MEERKEGGEAWVEVKKKRTKIGKKRIRRKGGGDGRRKLGRGREEGGNEKNERRKEGGRENNWKEIRKEENRGSRQTRKKKEGEKKKIKTIFIKFLYFLAGRDYNPSFSAFQMKPK